MESILFPIHTDISTLLRNEGKKVLWIRERKNGVLPQVWGAKRGNPLFFFLKEKEGQLLILDHLFHLKENISSYTSSWKSSQKLFSPKVRIENGCFNCKLESCGYISRYRTHKFFWYLWAYLIKLFLKSKVLLVWIESERVLYTPDKI